MRAILARSSEKTDVPWDVEKFFQSGVVEIDAMLHYAESFRPLREKNTRWISDVASDVLRKALPLTSIAYAE